MAIAKKSDLITEVVKGICKKVIGHTQGAGQAIDFQTRNNNTIIRKGNYSRKEASEKQRRQRRNFCYADASYRSLTDEQKRAWYIYTQEYNKKYKTNYSPHALWMKLFIEGKLDEFFEKQLGWRWGEILKSEYETHICWQLYIQSKGYEGISDELITDVGAVRR